jgi:thiol-disulfide isomerase/thioredoxin
MLRFLRAVAFVALALACVPGRAAFAEGDVPLTVGSVAPSFSEPTAGGAFNTATSGKPYVLELFAVWCPHCSNMVPVLDRLQQVDGDQVDIIAVPASPLSYDHTSPLTAADAASYAQRHNATYRIGFDGTFGVANAYGLSEFPTIYFVSADRRIVAVEAGEVPFEELAADVAAVLHRP